MVAVLGVEGREEVEDPEEGPEEGPGEVPGVVPEVGPEEVPEVGLGEGLEVDHHQKGQEGVDSEVGHPWKGRSRP